MDVACTGFYGFLEQVVHQRNHIPGICFFVVSAFFRITYTHLLQLAFYEFAVCDAFDKNKTQNHTKMLSKKTRFFPKYWEIFC